MPASLSSFTSRRTVCSVTPKRSASDSTDAAPCVRTSSSKATWRGLGVMVQSERAAKATPPRNDKRTKTKNQRALLYCLGFAFALQTSQKNTNERNRTALAGKVSRSRRSLRTRTLTRRPRLNSALRPAMTAFGGPVPGELGCDVLVVGGGINGAGIARDLPAAACASCCARRTTSRQHTSSSSTKLIHGGLRYLEYCEFSLVRKALAGARGAAAQRAAHHVAAALRDAARPAVERCGRPG